MSRYSGHLNSPRSHSAACHSCKGTGRLFRGPRPEACGVPCVLCSLWPCSVPRRVSSTLVAARGGSRTKLRLWGSACPPGPASSGPNCECPFREKRGAPQAASYQDCSAIPPTFRDQGRGWRDGSLKSCVSGSKAEVHPNYQETKEDN